MEKDEVFMIPYLQKNRPPSRSAGWATSTLTFVQLGADELRRRLGPVTLFI
jgi:hypothetical protein